MYRFILSRLSLSGINPFVWGLEHEYEKRVKKAGQFIRNRVVRNLSDPTRVHGPSQPGEYPHADTGRLRNDVFFSMVSKQEGIIGTRLDYGAIHETGARPFLSRTLQEHRSEINEIMTGRVRL